MNGNQIEYTTDLSQGVRMVRLPRLFAQTDKLAHTFTVTVKDGTQGADLSGLSATCYFIRADDSTVNIPGTVSGSAVTVSLVAACYEVPGHFSLVIKVYDTDHSTAVFWADGTVTRTSTDSVVDPARVVPDLAALLAQIERMETATDAAEDAAAAIDELTASATALAEGASPTASVTTVSGHKHVTFGIPKGDTGATGATGPQGETGATGATGATPSISIGTVTTLAAGSNAYVQRQSGDTDEAPVFDFGIPRGADGSFADMTGATASTAGAHGLVPAPAAGDNEKFLRGDGTWQTASGGSASDMTGASSSAAGTHGLVPAPAAGDQAKYLMGDGTWDTPAARHGTGTNAVVEGNTTNTASGQYAHAEGSGTTASGRYSHAEGSGTTASEWYTHAEGCSTAATNTYSHAEGFGTLANGEGAHAEGRYTTANHRSQHVFGEYNVLDASANAATARGDYVEIVGNGTGSSTSDRSNARTLDWSGNEVLAGTCTATAFIGDGSQLTNVGGGASLESVYPVGAVYISTVSTSPATLFGFGTWVQIQDTFLLAAGTTYAAGATGGEATHTLTVSEMPSHTHTMDGNILYYGSGSNRSLNTSGSSVTNGVLGNTGGDQPHNNMPPYLAVYMWERTA